MSTLGWLALYYKRKIGCNFGACERSEPLLSPNEGRTQALGLRTSSYYTYYKRNHKNIHVLLRLEQLPIRVKTGNESILCCELVDVQYVVDIVYA